jgi:hypothetical protein
VNIASQAGHLRILKSEELKTKFVNASSIDDVEALVNQYLAAVQEGRPRLSLHFYLVVAAFTLLSVASIIVPL